MMHTMRNAGFRDRPSQVTGGSLLVLNGRAPALVRVAGLSVVVCVWCFLASAAEKPDRDRLHDEARAYVLDPDCTQKEASAKFMAVIAADPSHWDNDMVLLSIADLLRHGDLYHGTCDPASALRVCQTVIDKFPPTRRSVILANITIGDIYLASGQLQTARAAYERVMHTDTSGPQWEGIREWVKMQADALAPVWVATALVPGAAVSGDATASTMPALSGDVSLDLKVLAEIPSRKDTGGPGISAIASARIVEASVREFVSAIRYELGVPLNVEDMPGQPRRVSVSADSLTAASLVDLYAASHGALETVKNDARSLALVWKDSPLKQASTLEFSVTDRPRFEALRIVCAEIQRALGPDFRAATGSYGGNFSESFFRDKVTFSVSGTPYEALDAWAATGPGICWLVYWRDAQTVRVSPSQTEMTPPVNPSISIVGKP